MKPWDDHYTLLMLSNELAALIHDIGKYSVGFVRAGTVGGNPTKAHTRDYFKDCGPLQNVLFERPLPQGWLEIPDDGRMNWKSLGELAKHHHYDKTLYADRFGKNSAGKLPSTLYFMMYADTTDSAAGKGGAGFGNSLLNKAKLKQHPDTCYLADPLGNCEYLKGAESLLHSLQENAEIFQQELGEHLHQALECETNVRQLISKREEIIRFLKHYFSKALAETRLPNNDVSLWQHSYSTCALFKAMLAGHALKGDWDQVCDEKGGLAYYQQHLAVIGICWDQKKLLSMSHRSAEILGLRLCLDQAAQEIKQYMETALCIGNEIYQDKNGIYFLVPDLQIGDPKQPQSFLEVLTKLETRVNAAMEKWFKGILEWTVKYQPIGLNVLEFSKIIQNAQEASQVLCSGPKTPSWVSAWQNGRNIEACPRCTLFPKSLEPVKSGSEGDTACEFCSAVAEQGGSYRHTQSITSQDQEQRKRLLGTDETAEYCTFDMNKLAGSAQEDQEGAGNRVALVQGVFDLRRLFNGELFSYILEARPEDFSQRNKKNAACDAIDSWDKILEAMHRNWEAVRQGTAGPDAPSLQTLQQIFQDKNLGVPQDGRVRGETGSEKAQALLLKHLRSPFPDYLHNEPSRLLNHALRHHPAPSRLAGFWNAALEFNRLPISFCEQNHIPYTPLSLDATRFMLLVPAARARQILDTVYTLYAERFARLRHLIPLHLSTVVFYHKAPLYIAIDAARRFEKIGLKSSESPRYFVLEAITSGGHSIELHLRLGQESVVWRVPKKLPNSEQDDFYSWYRVLEVPERPVHLRELEPGMTIEATPSSFDYEVLDATVRRYDILSASEDRGRPHLITGAHGPRPYLLERLSAWAACREPLSRIEEHQAHILMGKLAALHQEWSEYRQEPVFETMVRDFLCLSLKKVDHSFLPDLVTMGCSGELSDLFEWKNLISK